MTDQPISGGLAVPEDVRKRLVDQAVVVAKDVPQPRGAPITFACAVTSKGEVLLDFGTPIQWLAVRPDIARKMAGALRDTAIRAEAAGGIVLGVAPDMAEEEKKAWEAKRRR